MGVVTRCSRSTLAWRMLLILALIVTGFTAYRAYRLIVPGPAHQYSDDYGKILALACAGAWLAFAHAKSKPCAAVLWFGYIGLFAVVGMSVLDYALCRDVLPWILYGPLVGTLILRRTSGKRATFVYGAMVGLTLLVAAVLYNEPAGALGLLAAAAQLPRKT